MGFHPSRNRIAMH